MPSGLGLSSSFLTEQERELSDRFLARGYVITEAEYPEGLDRIRAEAARLAAEHLGEAAPRDPGVWLDSLHDRIDVAGLNSMRLAVIEGLNRNDWLARTYYEQARRALDTLVGNEVSMQRRINLSIQLPGDESSLLPVHADVWSGDSPYEIVLWIPLVDCFSTKSMFILEREKEEPVHARLAEFRTVGTAGLQREIGPQLTWLDVPYGHVLLFSQNLMHGNEINRETTTRWSMNCRFKSVFTPYADKKLGEFFVPVTLRAASRLGLDYNMPQGFDD